MSYSKSRRIEGNPRPTDPTPTTVGRGLSKDCPKGGRGSVEVIIAAGNQGRQRVIEELADLLYHLFVLLVNQEIDLQEVEAEPERRHKGAD